MRPPHGARMPIVDEIGSYSKRAQRALHVVACPGQMADNDNVLRSLSPHSGWPLHDIRGSRSTASCTRLTCHLVSGGPTAISQGRPIVVAFDGTGDLRRRSVCTVDKTH
jgi:hypothetical protein